jgi:GNAT superfamily N-acetyltransferase
MTADYAQAVRDGQAWAALKDGQIATQGRGIGARLLALAEEQARGLGLREIRLNANEA